MEINKLTPGAKIAIEVEVVNINADSNNYPINIKIGNDSSTNYKESDLLSAIIPRPADTLTELTDLLKRWNENVAREVADADYIQLFYDGSCNLCTFNDTYIEEFNTPSDLITYLKSDLEPTPKADKDNFWFENDRSEDAMRAIKMINRYYSGIANFYWFENGMERNKIKRDKIPSHLPQVTPLEAIALMGGEVKADKPDAVEWKPKVGEPAIYKKEDVMVLSMYCGHAWLARKSNPREPFTVLISELSPIPTPTMEEVSDDEILTEFARIDLDSWRDKEIIDFVRYFITKHKEGAKG